MDEKATNKSVVEAHSRKNIRLGAIFGYLSLVLSVVSGLIYTPWIKSTIGNSSYGLYTLSSSIISLFLFDFGLSATVNTFLARFRAKGDIQGERHFLGVIYKLYFIIDSVLLSLFVAFYFVIPYIYKGLTPEEISNLKVVFVISAAFSIVTFPCSTFSGVISAYEEYIWQNAINVIQKLLFIGLSAAAILGHLDLYGLVVANCLSGLITVGIKYVIMRTRTKARADFRYKPDKAYIKEILFFSIWAAVASITSRLVFNIMPSILGIVSDSDNIAVFGACVSLESHIYTLSNVIGVLYLPRIARMIREGKPQEEIDSLAIRVGKIQFFILALIVIGYASCGQEFLMLWMRDDPIYLGAYPALLMILGSQLVYIPQSVLHNEMYVTKNVKHVALISIIKALLNLGLAFVLGKYFGVIGAGASIGIARIVEVLFYNIAYRHDLKTNLGCFFFRTYVPFILAVAVSLGVGLTLHFVLPLSDLYRFLIIGFSVLVLFVSLSWFTAFGKEERSAILGRLKKRKKKAENAPSAE